MKNLKSSTKLLVAFLLALSAIVGVIGIVGMSTLHGADENVFKADFCPVAVMSGVDSELHAQHKYIRDWAVYNSTDEQFTTVTLR